MFRAILCCPLALALLAGCQRDDATPPPQEGAAMQLTSPAFAEGEPIPPKYGANGDNKSPPLKWNEVPQGVKSFALIVDDPDAPSKTWVHWVIWNLPADTRELAEGAAGPTLPDGAKQGKNDAGGVGYGGPAPPPGKAHRYFFKLYALDTTLDLKAGEATRQDLEQAMKGHVVGHGQLMGTFQK